jgi:hypothetical protein
MTRRTPGRTARLDNRRPTRSSFLRSRRHAEHKTNQLLTPHKSHHAAVRNGPDPALELRVVEGNVNRIKMIKRQMYGRAGFPLLRKRVLLAS